MNTYINDKAVAELTAEIGRGDEIYCVAHVTNDFTLESIVNWVVSDDFMEYRMWGCELQDEELNEYFDSIKALQHILKNLDLEPEVYMPGSLYDEIQAHLIELSDACIKRQLDENKRLAALIARARQDLIKLDETFNKLCDELIEANDVFSGIGDVKCSTINNIRYHLRAIDNVFERNDTIRCMQFGSRVNFAFASATVVSDAVEIGKKMFDYAPSDERHLAIDLISKRDHFELMSELVNGLKRMNLKSTARTSRARC